MEKKIIDGKAHAYMVFGFAARMAEMYLERRGAFEDNAFICGMLLGAAILLLLHAVFFLASSFARYVKKDQSQKDGASSAQNDK
ncbi:MAG: hypothetical protein IIY93_05850 [Clostridia bacterium]|nr:hypothetical protein [Clostridia bacterium]